MYQLITGRFQWKNDIRGALFFWKITSSLSCILLFQLHCHRPYYDQQQGKGMENQSNEKIYIFICVVGGCKGAEIQLLRGSLMCCYGVWCGCQGIYMVFWVITRASTIGCYYVLSGCCTWLCITSFQKTEYIYLIRLHNEMVISVLPL